MTRKLVDATERPSEGANRAFPEASQPISRRDESVVSTAEFAAWAASRQGFKAYLTEGKSLEGLDLTRNPSPGRDFEC